MFNAQIERRLKENGFKIKNISILKREDFESESPKYDKLIYVTYYVETNNANLLGESQDVFTEVYPRLKELRKDLLDGIRLNDQYRVEFVYSLNENEKEYGQSYKKAVINSYGDVVLPIDELGLANKYYKELSDKYTIYYGVKTNNGTVIGPDAGLIIGSCYIAKEYMDTGVDVIEIGAGTCSTPIAISDVCRVNSYFGVDFSEKMLKNYETKMKSILDSKSIKSEFTISDAFTCEFPRKADIFVLGIYYEAQLDFISKRWNDINESLKDTGMLIIQTGLPENRMINDLLMEDGQSWPWCSGKTCLPKIFKCVAQTNLENEIVIIATNNYDKFISVVGDIGSAYMVEKIYYNS